MTLPLRKKHLTTAKSIRQTTATKVTGRSWLGSVFQTALLSGCSIYAAASLSTFAMAQPPGWQPTRVPSQSDARPLATSQGATHQGSQHAGQGSGVALRWVSVTNGSAPASTAPVSSSVHSAFASTSMNAEQTFGARHSKSQSSDLLNRGLRTVQPAAAQSNGSASRAVTNAAGWSANPLRRDQGVRSANYQQQPANDPFGASQPALPSGDLPSLPPSNLPSYPPAELPQDPLSNAELPPVPAGEEVQPEVVGQFPSDAQKELQNDPSPFDNAPKKADPFGGDDKSAGDNAMEDKADEDDKREDLKMPKRSKNANITSCNDMRERVRQLRLSDISLNVSPEYGEGLRAREAGEKERLDFAASAPIRDWTDYTGTIVATGRLIDLRDDRVVLDLNGREQTIPLRDLSDIDVAYVAEAWNLPLQCGIGYEAYAGRQFIPSAVEWKASGLCHKPLYFEDVQLERYGHEVGPVLQPLLSSAHFFGNMLILPYKMGIHPPGECEYALGYYRPGNCAPYMIQPFPFSLRGAAAQAGFVTGAGVLIP